MSAVGELASVKLENRHFTAFTRLDNEELLKSVQFTVECVEKLSDLFRGGHILEALQAAKNARLNTMRSSVKNMITNEFKIMGRFLSDRDVVVSLFEGKLELEK